MNDRSVDPETRQLLLDLHTTSKVSLRKISETSQIIVSSKEFRTCLSDLSLIFRDIVKREVNTSSGGTGEQIADLAQSQKKNIKDVASESDSEAQQLASEARGKAEQTLQHANQAKLTSTEVTKKVTSGEKTVREGLHEHVDLAVNAINKVVPKEVQEVAGKIASQGFDQANRYTDKIQSEELNVSGALGMVFTDLKGSIAPTLSKIQLTEKDKAKIQGRIQRAIMRLQDRSDYCSSMGYLLDLLTHLSKQVKCSLDFFFLYFFLTPFFFPTITHMPTSKTCS